ncbi:hypothetical protein K493DRAFT_251304 [Basidiobolus meristosporus CBS 931.73]|uniref:Pyridoxal phosphate homeostasis protein n=1 Tax=Basidiobolus meristosporus CBS 931.73 TaxID=1314790 RepID=A0A1Y1ZAU2_9FUNG|nr:hypothetical protein K493DRAFT_251304 [Basidiobolus meristosporus CBS 931.73]|eukprot:ORY07214.1 hypothetical protein K493DRAFT_251304 [Basidiobolus meristosporus CBS 931.73]
MSAINPLTEEQKIERAEEVTYNLSQVIERVKAATPEKQTARLVAVSKIKPASDVLAAYNAGQRHFGENYVQELVDKSQELPKDINWHFIGTFQSNKAKMLSAIPNLWAVETIDSEKKARLLNKACEDVERVEKIRVFVQVNTSGEETKSGVEPDEVLPLAKYIVNSCSKLHFTGLMTIGAPDVPDDTAENPDFKLLSECRDKLQKELSLDGLELSMGMSGDYELALKQGSNNVRVGSSIFGARPKKVAQ